MKVHRRLVSLALVLLISLAFPLNAMATDYDIMADGEWTFVERSEHTITWEQATGAAVAINIAGKIAAKVPYLTPYAVQIAIGADALSIIAGMCNQGTVVVDFYTYTFPGQPIQYMYKWTFKPAGGSTYGPYRIVIDNQVASIGDPDELQ